MRYLFAALVLGMVGATVYFAMRQGSSAGMVAIMVMVLATIVSYKYLKNKVFEKGQPAQDERTRKVSLVAGSRAFLYSLWFILFLSIASIDLIEFRDVQQALGIAVSGMAMILGLCWLYYKRKENIEEISF